MKSTLHNLNFHTKAFLITTLLAWSLNPSGLLAQTQFWGMTTEGGVDGEGCIFKTDGSGNNYAVQQNFTRVPGYGPEYTALLKAADGKYYGMTQYGGKFGYGIIFQYDPASNTYLKKFDFDGVTHGSGPVGSLIQHPNGLMWGMTPWGGLYNKGVIFKYDPVSNTVTNMWDFDGGTSGANPNGSLILEGNLLYGVTSTGGITGYGILFSYSANGGPLTIQAQLSGTGTGTKATGQLCKARDGNFYGLTTMGGANNMGTLFQYNPNTNVLTKKYDMTTTALHPFGSLVLAPDSNLYGLTNNGGGFFNFGTLFRFNPYTNAFTVKSSLDTITGIDPLGSLTVANDGTLYGMTSARGANGGGTILQYDYVKDTLMVKYSLTEPTEGGHSKCSLMLAADGTFYGMTPQGGSNNGGVIFKFDPSANTFTKKINFNGSDNGQMPTGSLLRASDGMLYGMTPLAGFLGYGVLFQLNPFTNTYTIKHTFAFAEGAIPNGSLIQAANGKLYGMTSVGGANGNGVIFSYDPATEVYTKLYDFDGVAHGRAPYGSLLQASDGKFYGITLYGGAQDIGCVFQYDPVGNVVTKKFDLDFSIGCSSRGSFIEAPDGNLYCMTNSGGASNYGTLLQYDFVNNVKTVKVNFNLSNGLQPAGDLVLANDGKLYGMTTGGGVNSRGVIFRYDYVNNIYSKTVDLDLNTGSAPLGTFLKASNGLLYGMSSQGGLFSVGTLFEYNTVTNGFVKKLDFDTLNGASPEYHHLIEIYLINATTSVLANVSCHGGNDGSATVTPTAGTPPYSYSWSPSGGTGQTASNLAAGTYACTMKDSTGASVTVNVTITEPPVLVANISPAQNVRCFGGSDAIATVTASGGTGALSYLWAPSGCTTSTCNNLSAGTYTVIVTDGNGCTAADTVTVSQPPLLTTVTVVGNNASCASCADGTAYVIANGGVPGYTYSWNTTPVQTSFTATGLLPGTYTACVTDVNGCSSCSPVTITSPTVVDEILTPLFFIYPNPAGNHFMISFDNLLAADYELSISDVTGREVFYDSIENRNSYIVHQDFSPGLYFVHVRAENRTYVCKLVVE